MERRLVAILAADVVGYSRLVHADEEGTLRTLSAYREVIDGLVAAHRGRIFGTAGDSVIAEFASPVEAVRCAAELQQELGKRNADAILGNVYNMAIQGATRDNGHILYPRETI